MCTRISHFLIFIFHFDVKPPSLVRNQIRGHSSSADPAKRSPSNQYLKKHKVCSLKQGCGIVGTILYASRFLIDLHLFRILFCVLFRIFLLTNHNNTLI